MTTKILKFTACVSLALALGACKKETTTPSSPNLDKFVIATTITGADGKKTGYIGTIKDLSVTNYTNANARQYNSFPRVAVYKNDVFVFGGETDDGIVRKYTRLADGTLEQKESYTTSANSGASWIVFESETKAYLSLLKSSKIIVINPSTMTQISEIDLTSYDKEGTKIAPSAMAIKNGKLYVGCAQFNPSSFQTTYPAQLLIIDLSDYSKITSTTDARTTLTGSPQEYKALMFDENGDLYVSCLASFGFAQDGQKSGFLRIKKGETKFDPDYFLNVSDASITGVAAGEMAYMYRMRYYKDGIVYAMGEAKKGNQDFVKNRTWGSFKIDLRKQTITKLNIPYSNGQALAVEIYDGKVLFGISGTDAVGFYSYDPATDKASDKPIITTQGDPTVIEAFSNNQ